MFYAARAIMQFAYRIRAEHLSETSRSFCWRICQDQPGSWLPIELKVEGGRERERKSKLVWNDFACMATTNPDEKEASFWTNNGNATGFHFPASRIVLYLAEFSPGHVPSFKTITLTSSRPTSSIFIQWEIVSSYQYRILEDDVPSHDPEPGSI